MNFLKSLKTKVNNVIHSNPIVSKVAFAVTTVIATANTNAVMLRCDGLEGATDARDSIIDIVFGVYRTWWWLPFVIASLLFLFLKEDNKAKPVAKNWAIGLALGFIGTYAWDLIMATISKIAEVFG